LAGITEKYHAVFINPDLAGLYTAYLTLRAGARVGIIMETREGLEEKNSGPQMFPAQGSFFPHDVNLLLTDTGFSEPAWNRIPKIRIHAGNRDMVLNADDGMGGFLLRLNDQFRYDNSRWTGWLQEHIAKAGELESSEPGSRMSNLKSPETSVADSIQALNLTDAGPFMGMFDIMSILVIGRGIVQLDISDLPVLLAGFVSGWHVPVMRSGMDKGGWKAILESRLKESGASWLDVMSVVGIESDVQFPNMVRCSDGSSVSGNILVIPEGGRFRHPGSESDYRSISWINWTGSVPELHDEVQCVGLIRSDDNRAPINDNFISMHHDGEEGRLVTFGAPVEGRYTIPGEQSRLKTLESRIRLNLKTRMGWSVEEFDCSVSGISKPYISLPGTAATLSYPEGPVWGDDIYTRLRTAERLSRRLVANLKNPV